jgi:hypothetical protein
MKKRCFFTILLLIFTMGMGLYAPSIVEGKVYKTKDDALKEVFPDADAVEKINVFLGEKEQKRIEAIAKSKLESRIFTFYAGRKGNTIIGYAVFGSHVVRTKQEVYMVVINPDSSIRQVEILAFYEPEEYLPSKRWFQRFAGKILDNELWPRRGIIAVTGATLSVNGITQEIRKVLAVFKIMVIKEG